MDECQDDWGKCKGEHWMDGCGKLGDRDVWLGVRIEIRVDWGVWVGECESGNVRRSECGGTLDWERVKVRMWEGLNVGVKGGLIVWVRGGFGSRSCKEFECDKCKRGMEVCV